MSHYSSYCFCSVIRFTVFHFPVIIVCRCTRLVDSNTSIKPIVCTKILDNRSVAQFTSSPFGKVGIQFVVTGVYVLVRCVCLSLQFAAIMGHMGISKEKGTPTQVESVSTTDKWVEKGRLD